MARVGFLCAILFSVCGIFVYGDNADVTVARHLRLVHFEIDMLTSILAKKESIRRHLEHCVTDIETRLTNTSGLNSNSENGLDLRNLKSTLKDLKTLAMKEKDLYQNINRKVGELFPREILLRGRGKTSEMLSELGNILSRFTDVFAEPVEEDLESGCGVTPCFSPVYQMPQHMTSFSVLCGEMDCPSRTFALTEDGDILMPSWSGKNVMEYSGDDGSLINTFNLDFEPDHVASSGHGEFYVDTAPRNDRMIYAYNISSGELTLMLTIYDGMSDGLEFFDGMLFAGGKYGGGMHIYIPSSQRLVQVSKHITNYDQYYGVFMCATERGSNYGLMSGEMVNGAIILISSSGERICALRPPRYYSFRCGVVRHDGYFYLPGQSNIVLYDNRCEPVGEIDIPGEDTYIRDLDILNDTLYVNTNNGIFHLFHI